MRPKHSSLSKPTNLTKSLFFLNLSFTLTHPPNHHRPLQTHPPLSKLNSLTHSSLSKLTHSLPSLLVFNSPRLNSPTTKRHLSVSTHHRPHSVLSHHRRTCQPPSSSLRNLPPLTRFLSHSFSLMRHRPTLHLMQLPRSRIGLTRLSIEAGTRRLKLEPVEIFEPVD
jgi:hypothetical protein